MASDITKPRALTPQVQADIIKYLAEGNYFTTACLAAGVTRYCVFYWQKLWESGHESARVYDDFFNALARAQAIAEVNAVKAISEGKPGWQGPAWLIERRHPKRWNRKQHVDVTSDGKAMKSAVIEMPAKDLHDQDQASEGPADDVPRKPR